MSVVADGIAVALTTLVLAWVMNLARRPPAVVDGKLVLRYPTVVRWILGGGALLFVVGCAAVAWPVVAGHATNKDVVGLCITAAIALPLAFWVSRESRVRLEADAEGTRGVTAFRSLRSIAWSDVVSVRWSHGLGGFVVRDRLGETLRLSVFLQGIDAWLDILEHRVPEPLWRRAADAYRGRRR